MPGKPHVPGMWERMIRGQQAGTSRTAGGFARGSSPQMTRDRMAATMRGSGQLGTVTKQSHVDWFEVSDTSTSSFTLTYNPVAWSWNVTVNGLDLDEDAAGPEEFQIVGKTLTITDPADTFKGIVTQAPPWRMRVQYDYLAAAPVAPTVPLDGLIAITTGSLQPIAADLPSGLVAGMPMVAFFVGGWDVASGFSGWTQIESVTASGGSNTTYVRAYTRVADAGDVAAGQVTGMAAGGYFWTVAVVAASDHTGFGAHGLNSATGASVALPTPASAGGDLIVRCGLMRSSSASASLSVDRGTALGSHGSAATPVVVSQEVSDGSTSGGTVTASGNDASAGIVAVTAVLT